MSIFVEASRVPLFDRLCMPQTASAVVRQQAGDALRASLHEDLHRLLNTRNGMTPAQFLETPVSVLQYGMPDLLARSAQSVDDLRLLSEVVLRAVTAFEPRLADVRVQAQGDPAHPAKVRIGISGSLRVGHELQRVDFQLAPDGCTGRLSLLA